MHVNAHVTCTCACALPHICLTLIEHYACASCAYALQVGNGDRRLNRYRAFLQWYAAFGGPEGPSWETILAGARAGNASFEHFASAGELLGALITADGAIPKDVDSIILTQQTHFWPRGSAWEISDDLYAPSMVTPCEADRQQPQERTPTASSADGRTAGFTAGASSASEVMHVRTHRVPEMIDLRAQRGNKRTRFGAAWRSSRDIPPLLYARLAASKDGSEPCEQGRAASLCTSCSGPTHRLCECAAMALPPRALAAANARRNATALRLLTTRGGKSRRQHQPLSAMTRPEFDAEAVRACCQMAVNFDLPRA